MIHAIIGNITYMSKERILIASDHAGFDLKRQIKDAMRLIDFVDLGCKSDEVVDYPDYAYKLTNQLINSKIRYGILICKTGIGMSIAANRFPTIRAALCYNEMFVELSRQHNDANVLCLGAHNAKINNTIDMINKFIDTDFMGERHSERVNKLKDAQKHL